MSYPVYSERLLSTPGHVGWIYYDVPAGRRVVVKHIAAVNYTQDPVYMQVAVRAEAIFGREVPGPLNTLQVSGMWVAYAGEQLGIYLAALGVGATISGYAFADSEARSSGAYQLDPTAWVEPGEPLRNGL